MDITDADWNAGGAILIISEYVHAVFLTEKEHQGENYYSEQKIFREKGNINQNWNFVVIIKNVLWMEPRISNTVSLSSVKTYFFVEKKDIRQFFC